MYVLYYIVLYKLFLIFFKFGKDKPERFVRSDFQLV